MEKQSWAKGLLLASLTVPALSQSCISLSGSKQCPAFQDASISTTDSQLTGYFPFLSFVSSTQTFDQQLAQYVNSTYVQQKFQTLLGCTTVNLTNTADYYARYTTSVICNSIIQNSITPCALTGQAAAPLCAESCAQHAVTEEEIVVNKQLCGTPGNSFISQIRADFITCSLPDNSLTGSCISGEQNEPNNCGFANSVEGLCRYCGSNSPNATDSCCYNSNVQGVCSGVVLPTLGPMPSITFTQSTTMTSTATATATATADTSSSSSGGGGLSGGAIAGIVIGSIVAALLLAALLFFACLACRRRRERYISTSLNQPSPRRTPPSFAGVAVPGTAGSGRINRMTALEGAVSEKSHVMLEGHSDDESPESRVRSPAPVASARQGSLSSTSVFGGFEGSSPGRQVSSPGGMHSGQSEQLPFFKDYYSPDDIHPGDKVATLWAYQPRAADEFGLERGDMLKIVGIWDDGWATGMRIPDRAEEYDGKHKVQRDSGVSNVRRDSRSPEPQGDVKAFPLVCVCLPEYWKKTVEGEDSSASSTSPRQFDTRFPNF